MTPPSSRVSVSATLGGAVGATAAGFVAIGTGGAALQVLSPFGGFLLTVFGAGLAVVAVFTGIAGLVATAPSKGLQGRSAALRGLLLGLVIVGALAVPASQGRGLPPIHDVTTNVDDPPLFVTALQDPANEGRDLAWPGDDCANQQMAAYPDLATLVVDEGPDAAYDRVRAVVAAMERTDITGEDREGGRLEATRLSAVYHFADDIVVRIRPFDEAGSRIDIRSRTRDLRADRGANAANIREILAGLRATLPPPVTE